MATKKNISVRIPEVWESQIKELAEAQGVSVMDYLRAAFELKMFIDRNASDDSQLHLTRFKGSTNPGDVMAFDISKHTRKVSNG